MFDCKVQEIVTENWKQKKQTFKRNKSWPVEKLKEAIDVLAGFIKMVPLNENVSKRPKDM